MGVVLGVGALVIGAFDLAMAARLRRLIGNEWLLAAVGLLSLAFGAATILAAPFIAREPVWMVAAYAFAVGVQWHPEMLIHTVPTHLALYKAFVARAKEMRR